MLLPWILIVYFLHNVAWQQVIECWLKRRAPIPRNATTSLFRPARCSVNTHTHTHHRSPRFPALPAPPPDLRVAAPVQVHMLNSRRITAAFNMNYTVMKPLVFQVFLNGLLELNPLGQVVRDWACGVFWVFITIAILLIPKELDRLLNFAVHHKKEEAKKRWAGVAGMVKGGKAFRDKANTVKVAPAPK